MFEKARRVAHIQKRAAANAIAKRAPERARETRYFDYVFCYPSRSIVGRAVAEGLTWDPHLSKIIDLLPHRATVCEVGSNIGASLLTMAHTRSDLRFICFEPSPRFLPYLKNNVERNDLADRVTVEGKLVGPEGGTWELTSNTSSASVVASRYDHHIPLETAPFDAVALDEYFVDRENPALIKIDTDGFELRVLGSALKILHRAHPHLFIEYTPSLLRRAGDDEDVLREFLLQARYYCADVYAGDGSLLARDRSLADPLRTDSYFDLFLPGGQ